VGLWQYIQIDRRLLKHFDYSILILITLLSLLGIVVIYGSTHAIPHLQGIAKRQAVWILVGLIAFAVAISFDYRHLDRFAYPLYLISVMLLVVLLVRGMTIKGSASWFTFGRIRMQPSEFAKLAVVIMLASYLSKRTLRIQKFHQVAIPLALVALPTLLILKQPDIGMASIFVTVLFIMLFICGAGKRVLIGLILLLLLGAGAMYPFLKSYQKERIAIFLNPGSDALNRGYNIIQAKIALGSGRLTGKGWKQGTQTALQFLPEHHTDFIFSSLGEQFGIVGCLGLLLLYALLISRGMKIARDAQDFFGCYLVIGLLAVFVIQVLVNVGMSVGLLPVTGLTLPFISYGGSSLVTNFLLFGLITNVGMRKFMF
jgi:rod shape determining protein RodA